jgi:hypothetical protein
MEEDKIKDSEATTSESAEGTAKEVSPEAVPELEVGEGEEVEVVESEAVEEVSEVKPEEELDHPAVETFSEEKETVPPVEPVVEAEAPVEEPTVEPKVSEKNYADEPFLADHHVKSSITPKWNWGAMAMPVFFGIANRSYLGLLSLLAIIPWIGWIFGIVWAIVFGLNGERWALQNPDNRYRDEEEFRKVMDGWNRAGLVAFIIGVIAFVFVLLFFLVLGAAIFSNMGQLQY